MSENMDQPKVIFLDAVGTLFGVRGYVGEIYSEIVGRFGIQVDPAPLQQAFSDSFHNASPLIFPGVDSQQIPEQEFQWWKKVVENTFKHEQVAMFEQIPDFNAFFTQVYARFATPKPWYVYPDTIPMLSAWQAQGIELGIISNFDTRLYGLIELLGLKDFFSSITLSSIIGAAKPDSKIFITALQKYNCTPEQAWHIGDSLEEDYYGAKAAGLKAFLIQRSNLLISPVHLPSDTIREQG